MHTHFPDHCQSTNSEGQSGDWLYAPTKNRCILPNDANDENNRRHEKCPDTNENQQKWYRQSHRHGVIPIFSHDVENNDN